MELIFIRHGEPDWTPDGFARNDPGLTELGRLQARRVAEHLRSLEVDHLWVSPAKRAQETVIPIAEALQMVPRQEDWLMEAAAPDWQGKPATYIRDLILSGRTRSVAQWWEGLPGGESLTEFVARIGEGLDATLTELGAQVGQKREGLGLWQRLPREGRIVAVCHAGTTSAALTHLLGLPQVPWAWERFTVGHASATRLASAPIAQGAIFSLRSLGDERHLGEHTSR